ncbi:DUF6559 family protein [Pseudomaricurvus alkylphenolicus]|uniref:DUF6559 family protein n=1 Tax=Pseudomaricurvus alkylphenolicus TaxID=1306991 RepID=UPI003B834995
MLAGTKLNIRVLIRNLFYRFQYLKYVRYLPFYLARDHGVKKTYTTNQIDHSIRRYNFKTRYAPIAYALYGSESSYLEASSKYQPHPDRIYIRRVIGRIYEVDPDDICMCKLLNFSMFKSSYHPGAYDWTEKQYNKDYDRLCRYIKKCKNLDKSC